MEEVRSMSIITLLCLIAAVVYLLAGDERATQPRQDPPA
jgi:hypothetical protein